MQRHHHHKIFMGLISVATLIIGLVFGIFLRTNSNGDLNLQGMNFALLLTTIILLLMTGGIVLEIKVEIKDMLMKQTKMKK
jgi:uncharacterized integral membrane protein